MSNKYLNKTENNQTHQYVNKNFIRDQPQLLGKIVRRTHMIIQKERLQRDCGILKDLNKTMDITGSNHQFGLSKIFVETNNQLITYYVPITTTQL